VGRVPADASDDVASALDTARELLLWLLSSQWDRYRSYVVWRDLRRGAAAAPTVRLSTGNI